MDLLSKLAVKYRTDKAPAFHKHSYTPYYYKILNKKRNKIKKVLEIGVGSGASLRMWRDFFPNARIYGADYRPDRIFTEDRIQIFLVDQRRGAHLDRLIRKIGSDIDLVIEDGSHRPRDQVYTCTRLMPLLKKGVIYVIEDVYRPGISQTISNYGYAVKKPKLEPIKRFDNTLIVVKHKSTTAKLTFFAKPAFRLRHDGYLKRISSIIRGDQVAEYLGAKLNPTKNYQNDVCIYVKPPYKRGQDFIFEGRKSYLDIVDDLGYVDMLRNYPEVGVISLSDWNTKVLKKLLPNRVVTIPQHHCNFERVIRKSNGIKKIGIIGAPKAFEYLPKGLKTNLKRRGIQLVEFSEFSTRQDIIDFYMSIDLQVVWRPYYNYRKDILINPLKIVNASSFGVPTIAYEEPAFLEVEGCYIPVHTLEEFLTQVDKLRNDQELYKKYSNTCLQMAENYHIEKIAQLYKNLLLL